MKKLSKEQKSLFERLSSERFRPTYCEPQLLDVAESLVSMGLAIKVRSDPIGAFFIRTNESNKMLNNLEIKSFVKPPWKLEKSEPPIILFYSFAGGVGRSTILAATALQLASIGNRIVIIDTNFDTPGIGTLLNSSNTFSTFGVIDYFLEDSNTRNIKSIENYYFKYSLEELHKNGEILVFPSGIFNNQYLEKLMCLDYELTPEEQKYSFQQLLQQIHDELKPDWILINSRIIFNNILGFLINGFCHFNIILTRYSVVYSEQYFQYLRYILNEFGINRLNLGYSQTKCMIVATMLPGEPGTLEFKQATKFFQNQIKNIFDEYYYAIEKKEKNYWTMESIINTINAPHMPEFFHFNKNLAFFDNLTDVIKLFLMGEPYIRFVNRIQLNVEQIRNNK